MDAMNLDVIIVGRGGGSIEDLWAFNSEIVAMLAAGVSFKRLLRPYMFSCVLIAMLSYYLSAYVIPHGTVIRQNFEAKYKNRAKNTSAVRTCFLHIRAGHARTSLRRHM